jgi:hypothetical protein
MSTRLGCAARPFPAGIFELWWGREPLRERENACAREKERRARDRGSENMRKQDIKETNEGDGLREVGVEGNERG